MSPIFLFVLSHLLVDKFGILMSDTNLTPFPCRLKVDNYYRQTMCLDCQHAGITSITVIKKWITPNITRLLLDYNNINSLNNADFSPPETWRNLRFLGLSHNKISSIVPFTFRALKSLVVLRLNHNKISLDEGSLSGDVFHGLGNLKKLSLHFNENKNALSGKYPNNLFSDLKNLTDLSLDTFRQDLKFGSLFKNTKQLETLNLTGGMKAISNKSFGSFKYLKLKRLRIAEALYLTSTDIWAFRYLKTLESYNLYNTIQDVATTLKSLAPFVNRTMTDLIFDKLNFDYRKAELFANNSIVTREMAKYLMKICVRQFYLRSSNVFLFELGILSSPKLRICLEDLNLAYNPMQGTMLQLYSLVFLQRIRRIKLSSGKYFKASFRAKTWFPPSCSKKPKLFTINDTEKTMKPHLPITRLDANIKDIHLPTPASNRGVIHDFVDTFTSIENSHLNPKDSFYSSSNFLPVKLDKNKVNTRYRFIPLPKNLRIGIFNSLIYNGENLDGIVQVLGGANLKKLCIADNGFKNFIGVIKGLPKLEVLDISKNNGSAISSYIFDTMISIRHLNMADMKLSTTFMAKHSERLFKPLLKLNTLDLSHNELPLLAKDIFSVNKNLSVLILTGNKFESIPFKLNHVPYLCWIDLRYNSFRQMSVQDIEMLEEHFKTSNSLSLSLEGNEFYCGCINILFLSWLHNTKIHLDNNRNYSCILDSGQTSATGDINNLEAMWRKCHGYTAFLISLILASLMVFGSVCCIMIPKFKTQMKAFILRTFWTPFIMKEPMDYSIGVCIAYADHDTNLACLRLRPFIEERLRLNTYIRHRDLLPASDIAESIMEAVNSSWRVLLVVSQYFLDDPWSYFYMKASTFAVQTENPGRIVLILVGDGDQETLLTRIPSSVLQAVREEHIIRMTPQGNISYEDKQALKTALVYSG